MQRILLYEFVTSGGLLGDSKPPPIESICREGAAMMTALAADFAAVEGVEAVAMVDWRSTLSLPDCRIVPIHSAEEESAILSEWTCNVEWTVVVAPEFDDLLGSRCRWVEESGGRLLGPSSSLAALAADKHRTAEHLSADGLPVPYGIALAGGDSVPAAFPFPAVIKPRFGAGSQDLRLVDDAPSAENYLNHFAGPARLEEFRAGTAVSVACLCGPAGRMALPPCRQRLSDDGRFRYSGGALPLEPELARRAAALADRTIAALPDPLGYLGVDLVLGPEPSGRTDIVIEVNPRLTTSYVGLRAATGDNLAAAMLNMASGKTPRLSFTGRRIGFSSDGTIYDSTAS